MDHIFLMGHDAWGNGEPVPKYLASCRESPKYKRGEWFLLDHHEHGPISSLILYRLSPDSAGIGSIATAPHKRKQGFAAHLIQSVVSFLDLQGTRAVFLFSDIAPRFYERFGFKPLPPEHQKHPGRVCMMRARSGSVFLNEPGFRPPDYF